MEHAIQSKDAIMLGDEETTFTHVNGGITVFKKGSYDMIVYDLGSLLTVGGIVTGGKIYLNTGYTGTYRLPEKIGNMYTVKNDWYTLDISYPLWDGSFSGPSPSANYHWWTDIPNQEEFRNGLDRHRMFVENNRLIGLKGTVVGRDDFPTAILEDDDVIFYDGTRMYLERVLSNTFFHAIDSDSVSVLVYYDGEVVILPLRDGFEPHMAEKVGGNFMVYDKHEDTLEISNWYNEYSDGMLMIYEYDIVYYFPEDHEDVKYFIRDDANLDALLYDLNIEDFDSLEQYKIAIRSYYRKAFEANDGYNGESLEDELAIHYGCYSFFSNYPHSPYSDITDLASISNGALHAIKGPTKDNPHDFTYEFLGEEITMPFVVVKAEGKGDKPYALYKDEKYYFPNGETLTLTDTINYDCESWYYSIYKGYIEEFERLYFPRCKIGKC